MNRLFALGMSTVLALPILSTVIVLAQDTTTTPTTTQTETEKPRTPEEIKALIDRVQARKTELKTKLRVTEKARIQSKCKASQGKVSSIKGRVNGLETSRGQVYKNVVNRLKDLSEKLKNRGADTTALDAAIVTLESKIATFQTSLAAYKEDVSDLAALDCQSDPDGFKASLDASRLAQQQASQDAKAVKGYVNETIKPILKTIRAELEATKPAGDATTTTDGGNQ